MREAWIANLLAQGCPTKEVVYHLPWARSAEVAAVRKKYRVKIRKLSEFKGTREYWPMMRVLFGWDGRKSPEATPSPLPLTDKESQQ